MIAPRDAWLFRRLLTGHDPNGELRAVSGRFKPLADHLAGLTPEARSGAWQAFLAGQDDRDGLITALAEIDPTGPPPEARPDDDEADDDWKPIRLGSLPPAEPFPLDVLAWPARDLAEASARSIPCPVDFPAVAALAVASGMIGRSASLLVKDGYFTSASLYVAIVGGPSSGKSPALGHALAPVWSIGRTLHDEWRSKKESWKLAPEADRGDEPALVRVVTSDTTTEALALILAENPRGMMLAPDEMTRWIMSLDQYKGGKGGDRPFYLSTWNGEPVFIDRAKHAREPVTVPHPFLTVMGGMTPDMLTTLPEGKGREDGFMARLLFAFPERIARTYSDQGIPPGVAESWEALARSLWGRPMRQRDGRSAPHVVTMTPDARREWRAWVESHYSEQQADDFPDGLEGPWGKLEAYAARLALILHLMDLAADPTRPTADDPPDLTRRSIVDAARLVAYFKSHARRVRDAMDGRADDGGDHVRALLRWIIRNDRSEFSERDIGKNFDRFKDDPAALDDALSRMVALHLIRPQPVPEAPKPGRKRSPTYEVNPSLKDSPRFRRFRQNGRT